MQSGRKPTPVAQHMAQGTYQPCRHADREEIVVPDKEPVMPEWLPRAAKKIWKEELPRVLEVGITETDTSFFARYCALEATLRETIKNGEVPMGNLLSEHRKCAELLGIAGPSSRVKRAAKAPETNPFAALGLGPKSN